MLIFPNLCLNAENDSSDIEASEGARINTSDCDQSSTGSWWLGLDGRLHTGYDSSICLGAGTPLLYREEALSTIVQLLDCDLVGTSCFFRSDGKIHTQFAGPEEDIISSTLCLDVVDSEATSGRGLIRLQGCDDVDTEDWFPPVQVKQLRLGNPDGDTKSIQHYDLNLCLDTSSSLGYFPAQRAQFILVSCDSSLSSWSFSYENKLVFDNVAFSNSVNLCMDLQTDTRRKKDILQLWNCSHTQDTWSFRSNKKLQSSIRTSFCLNIQGMNPTSGDQIGDRSLL